MKYASTNQLKYFGKESTIAELLQGDIFSYRHRSYNGINYWSRIIYLVIDITPTSGIKSVLLQLSPWNTKKTVEKDCDYLYARSGKRINIFKYTKVPDNLRSI